MNPSAAFLARVATPALAAAALLAGASLQAQVVAFNFSGTIQNAFDGASYLPTDIVEGSTFTGTISYDVANLVDANGSASNGSYHFNGAVAGQFQMSVHISTVANTYHFTSVVAPSLQDNFIEVFLGAPYNSISYISGEPLLNGAQFSSTSNGSTMSVELNDPSKTAFANDSVPVTVPNASAFAGRGLFISVLVEGNNDVATIYGPIDTFTAVPEPMHVGTVAGGALVAFAMWSRARRNRA